MKVSIIIAIYNIENYIKRCLDGIIQLDNRIVEIICVNDGSTDNSGKIVEEYGKKDSRIKLINKVNGGISNARNVGVKEAQGEYLIFVDGDDYIFPEKLKKVLDEVENLTDVDVVWMGYIREDWNGIYTVNTRLEEGYQNKEKIQQQFIPSLIGISYTKLYAWFRGEQSLNQHQEFPAVWRGIYSRRTIQRNNVKFNERVLTGEDVLFNWDFFSCVTNMYVMNQNNYYCYAWRKGSLTEASDLDFLESRKCFIREREKQNSKILNLIGVDYSKEYEASLVLTKLQMAIVLASGKVGHLVGRYKQYKDYVDYAGINYACKNLNLKDAPLKYKLVFGIAKYNMNLLLFFGCVIMNRLNIRIYPDE